MGSSMISNSNDLLLFVKAKRGGGGGEVVDLKQIAYICNLPVIHTYKHTK